jgi:arabinogalactan oligomer/maltooligosaccharide transport system permease protein
MTRWRSALRAAVAMVALVLAMLGVEDSALATPIRLWHAYRGDEEKALAAVLASWTGEPVETLAVPYDALGNKLASAIPLGEGPDLFVDQHERLGDYRARGIVAPVGDAIDTGAAYSPLTLDAVAADGQTWAVPLAQKCMALFVNIDLVREVPPDVEGIAELRSSLPPDVFPLAYEAQSAYAHAALLSAFGSALLSPRDEWAFIGPSAERSIVFARELIDAHVVPEDADGALVTSLFRSGHAAFAISGPWLATDLGERSPVRYRVVPLPRVRETGELMRPFLGVESIMLSPSGAQRGEVRALSRYLASTHAALVRARMARVLPARTDVPLPEGDALLAAFAAQAATSIPMPSSRAMRATWEPAYRAIRKVLRRDSDSESALREAKRRFDDVRRPAPPPASPAPLAMVLGAVALMGAFALVRAARRGELGPRLSASLPAYRYVLHAVLVVGILVVVPLAIGAGTSLYAGGSGDMHYVGLANFFDILTARGGPLLASGSFYLVLLVTIAWTLANLFFHLVIGLALGLLLARPALRFKAVYRVLLIIPWAVPSYVTALAWKGMFHRQFGAVTGLIVAVNGALGTTMEPIAWFSRFSTAFAANLATNVWLGFPFMMVVTIGALTAVPEDVLEAARVDGASRWQRLRRVTLPIIAPTLAPSVTLGAVWTFNMFNVVFLVSGGDPDGTTDILVSEAYRWAFTREAQYGYAAAYAVLIFLLLSGATRIRGALGERGGAPAIDVSTTEAVLP